MASGRRGHCRIERGTCSPLVPSQPYLCKPQADVEHRSYLNSANRAGAKRGKQPVWLSTVMRDYIQPMARKLGIQKKMSWHTFRHTFSSILKGNGEDVKVVQELLRHSTSRMTLDTYTQALGPDKRAAQSKVVGMIRPKERVFSVYRDADGVSVESID